VVGPSRLWPFPFEVRGLGLEVRGLGPKRVLSFCTKSKLSVYRYLIYPLISYHLSSSPIYLLYLYST